MESTMRVVPAPLEVTVTPDGVVHARGRIDVTTVAELREGLHAVIDALPVSTDRRVVLDVHALDLSDATGLGALLSAHRRAARHGHTLVLRAVPAPLARLLWRTRLGRVLHVELAA